MFRLNSFTKNSHSHLALEISTPYDDYDNYDTNMLRIGIWKYCWYFHIPAIIHPKRKWIDLSDKEWATEHNGVKGYEEKIQKVYGFAFNDAAIHVHYGIQPMSWSSNDPDNSDHTKLYSYFWNYHHVDHIAYYADGEHLCHGEHLKQWEYKYLYQKYTEETKNNVFHSIPWYIFPKDRNYSWDTRRCFDEYDNFSDVSTDKQVYKIFEYVDKYDNTTTEIRCNMESRKWIRGKWKWLRTILQYVPGCVLERRTLECYAKDELGNRKSSWKGGTMGWGFDMKPNETMDDCYGRMLTEWSPDR